jgi:di/tricarboxylate transporter
MRGLRTAGEAHLPAATKGAGAQRFYEAVLGPGSPLTGSTLKEADFRRRHGAAVLAIHRSGEALRRKLGDVRLRAGDVLLLIGPPALNRRWRDRPDFLVLAPVEGTTPVRRRRARLVQLIALGFIVAAGTGVVSLLQASLLTVIALLGLKVIGPGEARSSVNIDVILLMATSFGLGAAIAESGLAEEIALLVVGGLEPLGDIGILAGIVLATMLVTELLSNNAAAILMFPIALETAAQAGLQVRPFAIAILFAASLSFLTPIGYQANTLVWSMGGYRYRDFTRLGAPLTVFCGVATTVLVPLFFPLR